MGLTWTRNNRDIWYLVAIFLITLSLSLSMKYIWLIRDTAVEDGSFLGYILFTAIHFSYYVPVLSHLPAFVYGRITRDPSRDAPGTTESYFVALLASITVSLAVTIRITMLFGLPPAYPSWQIDVLFVVAVLLVPAYHAYSDYDTHGNVRRGILLVMVYAPWVQIVRLLTARMELR